MKLKENEEVDHYHQHFAELPETIKIVKWHQESRKHQVDRQVRGEIKEMFLKKRDEGDDRPDEDDEEMMKMSTNNKKQLEEELDFEFSNPYNLVKNKEAEKEIIIGEESLNLFTSEAVTRK